MKRVAALSVMFAGVLAAQGLRPGATVSDFKVTAPDGSPVSISSFRGSPTVVAFVSTKCPVSNRYNERMKALHADYAAKGVKFLFVNSNVNEPADEVASHTRQHGFAFPVHKDPNNVVADLFGAQATPETYLIDSQGVVRYHGSIDDSQNEANIKVRGLRNALDAVLAGKAPEVAETKAFGCTIKRVQKTS